MPLISNHLMDNFPIIVISIVLLGLILNYLFFSRQAVVSNTISKTPRKKLSEVKDGETVSISGKVVFSGRVMTAPLSKRKCVYYHVIVKDANSSRDTFRNYIDIDEEKASDVVLFDGEHYAIISTKSVKAYIVKDETFYSGFWNSTTPELKEYLVKHGEKTTNMLGFSLNLSAQEGVLEAGEKLKVAGKASWHKSSDFKLKIPHQKVLFIQASDEQAVFITDDPYVE